MNQNNGDGSTPIERRGDQRYVAFFPIRLLPGEGMKRLCICQDMSTSGGLMMTQTPLTVGQRVEVALQLPERKERPRKVGARVVRVGERSTNNRFWKYEAALKFERRLIDEVPELIHLSNKQGRGRD
jgi:PilZ domain